jgi:thiol:disulfide interchange protein DsbD
MDQLSGSLEVYLKTSSLMSLVAAFLGGILTSLTPCVYPLIPVTAGYVGNRNLGGSKARAFLLTVAYVAGVAVTYALLGVIAAMTGQLFGSIATNPWVYLIVANIIILSGLVMLEVFTIPMIGLKSTPEAGGFFGLFLLGMASGLLAGPCTAPALGVLLGYVAASRDVVFGASVLFAFAFGMCLLLIVVGTFSGVMASLPRSGLWMVRIKKAMGLAMIALGEYFLIKMGQLMI